MDKAFTNAMDSSVCSSTASFGPLEVNTCTGNGPINRLPNEMMQLIMAKLGLDGDVKKLVRLRLVSTKWRAVVEYYCGLKKSLFVQFNSRAVVSKDYLKSFEEIFFGFANSNNFTCLFLSTKIPSECLSSMLNMFPNIEQLSINWSYYFVNERTLNSLQVYIKSLDSLKVLDLNRSSMTQLSSALSKLEHFSHNSFAINHTDDDILQVISHLGPSCVRANFWKCFSCDQVLQWATVNPLWLANLTHLRMLIGGSSADCARVVHFLSEHAMLLQHLDFNTTYKRNSLVEYAGPNHDLKQIELPSSIWNLESTYLLGEPQLLSKFTVLNLGYPNELTRDQWKLFPNLTAVDLGNIQSHSKFMRLVTDIQFLKLVRNLKMTFIITRDFEHDLEQDPVDLPQLPSVTNLKLSLETNRSIDWYSSFKSLQLSLKMFPNVKSVHLDYSYNGSLSSYRVVKWMANIFLKVLILMLKWHVRRQFPGVECTFREPTLFDKFIITILG